MTSQQWKRKHRAREARLKAWFNWGHRAGFGYYDGRWYK